MKSAAILFKRTFLPASVAAAALLTAATLCALPVAAHVAGASTTTTASISESTQVAMGWSVKKTLHGKNIYNETGARIGRIEDLIISPDKNVSYVIVGAGGFIGIGRHDVAVPVMQHRCGRIGRAGKTGFAPDRLAPGCENLRRKTNRA